MGLQCSEFNLSGWSAMSSVAKQQKDTKIRFFSKAAINTEWFKAVANLRSTTAGSVDLFKNCRTFHNNHDWGALQNWEERFLSRWCYLKTEAWVLSYLKVMLLRIIVVNDLDKIKKSAVAVVIAALHQISNGLAATRTAWLAHSQF